MTKNTVMTLLKCPICKNENCNIIKAQKNYMLAKCSACQMLWDHLANDMQYMYEEDYFVNNNLKGGYTNYFEGMKINKKTFNKRLITIEKKLGHKGRILDVGCALGECINEAIELGWKDVHGIEISEYASSCAKKRGLPVKKGKLSDGMFEPASFDVILYQDVIEHVTNPVFELKEAHKALKKDGMIFLITPNIKGYWALWLGSLWYHYKPKEHIMYFCKNSLARALKEAGFSEIKIKRTYHILSIEYTLTRLKYYSPKFFQFCLTIAKLLHIENRAYKISTGEIEAWAKK